MYQLIRRSIIFYCLRINSHFRTTNIAPIYLFHFSSYTTRYINFLFLFIGAPTSILTAHFLQNGITSDTDRTFMIIFILVPNNTGNKTYILYTDNNNNNNNNRLYYLEFRACDICVYALSIIFYVQRYLYALLISLKHY